MSDTKFGLSDFAVNDDLDVAMDNETYQDQANPAPPVAGNYRFKILTLDKRTKKDGSVVTEGDGFPIFVIGMAEIVEGYKDAQGNETTRKVGLFQDVKTKPYLRQGVPASGIADLTRALGTESYSRLSEGIERLKEAFETDATFVANLDWSAYDGVFIKAALAQLEIPENKDDRSDDEKKIVSAIYNAGRIQGMRFFPVDPNSGKFIGSLTRENVTFRNPVTNANVEVEAEHRVLEARPYLARYYSKKSEEGRPTKLGPSNVKPALAKAA
jgi:hypothetical protein